jgi:hypothetical protein
MPVESILIGAGVVLMFVTFAVVLAWGDRQTRPQKSAQQSGTERRAF